MNTLISIIAMIFLINSCQVIRRPAKREKGIHHIVSEGQTIARISEAYRVSIDRIKKENKLKGTFIIPGQKLVIPGVFYHRYVPSYPKREKPMWLLDDSRQSVKRKIYDNKVKKEEATKRSERKKKEADNQKLKSLAGVELIWPLKGKITSTFGPRWKKMHKGLDISSRKGNPIVASAKGHVIYSGNGLKGYGNLVVVQHNDRVATVYAHNKENLVSEHDLVDQGQVVATVGNTGRSTGDHLHFEVRVDKIAQNPLQYLPK